MDKLIVGIWLCTVVFAFINGVLFAVNGSKSFYKKRTDNFYYIDEGRLRITEAEMITISVLNTVVILLDSLLQCNQSQMQYSWHKKLALGQLALCVAVFYGSIFQYISMKRSLNENLDQPFQEQDDDFMYQVVCWLCFAICGIQTVMGSIGFYSNLKLPEE